MNDVLDRIAHANPVPEELPATAWQRSVLLDEVDARRGLMTKMDQEPTAAPAAQKPRRNRMAIAAIAFAAVVLVVGLMALVAPDNTDEIADTPTTVPPTTAAPTTSAAPTTTVATSEASAVVPDDIAAVISRIETAWNSGDADGLVSLFAPGLVATRPQSGQTYEMDLYLGPIAERSVATGEHIHFNDCEMRDAAVRCTATWSGLMRDLVGVDYGFFVTAAFEDGIVTSWEEVLINEQAETIALVGFRDWLNEVYPDETGQIINPAGFAGSAETAELYVERMMEYLEFTGN